MKYFIYLLFLKHLFCQIYNFRFALTQKEKNCLKENFPEKTLVIFNVISNKTNVKFTIKDSKKKIMTTQEGTIFKFPFTTYEKGYYEICFENLEKEITFLFFKLKYGVAAKDYSSIVKTMDLKPIDIEIEKLIEKNQNINNFMNMASNYEKMFIASLNSVKGKMIIFTGLCITAMIGIVGFETFILKKFMERRKII
jgi:hypothetical protein